MNNLLTEEQAWILIQESEMDDDDKMELFHIWKRKGWIQDTNIIKNM